MEFLRGGLDSQECFLCVAAKQTDDRATLVINRGEHCFCLLNRFPYSNGHLLVCPQRHIGRMDQLNDAEMLEIMQMARDAQAALQKSVNAHGYNMGFNLGHAAGAGLEEHLHLHVVPRWIGDTNFMPVIADVKIIPQALEELAELLRKNWQQ